jgi:hypothetical protein
MILSIGGFLMPGTLTDVTDDPFWTKEWENVSGEPKCAGKLFVYISKKAGRIVLSCRFPHRRRRRRFDKRRRPRGYRVTSSFSRYREYEIPLNAAQAGVLNGKKLVAGSPIGKLITYSDGVPLSTFTFQLTGTPGATFGKVRTWDQVNSGPPYKVGGPFGSIKYFIPSSLVQGGGVFTNIGKPGISSANRTEYNGSFVDGGSWPSDISEYSQATLPALTGYDTLAWDKCKPRISQASLSQFLYELRDLPRMLMTSGKAFKRLYNQGEWLGLSSKNGRQRLYDVDPYQIPSEISDQWLNHEFGWAPFISDIWKMINIFRDSERYIEQLVAQNRRYVRKRAVLDSTESVVLRFRRYKSETSPDSNAEGIRQMCNPYTLDGRTCFGHSDYTEVIKTKVWAVGSFLYYRPEFDPDVGDLPGVIGDLERLLTLYGLRITPAAIYRVIPWTWLVDWFTGFGSFIQRLDDFVTDGIVSRYLYVMRTTEKFYTKTSYINFYGSPVTLHWQRTLSIKQRRVADSPYGFDKPWNGLTTRQIGILGALGIGRTSGGFISRGA